MLYPCSSAAKVILCSFTLSYYTWGEHNPAFILDVLPSGANRTACNAVLLIHMLISYVIKQQLFNRWIFNSLFPQYNLKVYRNFMFRT